MCHDCIQFSCCDNKVNIKENKQLQAEVNELKRSLDYCNWECEQAMDRRIEAEKDNQKLREENEKLIGKNAQLKHAVDYYFRAYESAIKRENQYILSPLRETLKRAQFQFEAIMCVYHEGAELYPLKDAARHMANAAGLGCEIVKKALTGEEDDKS